MSISKCLALGFKYLALVFLTGAFFHPLLPLLIAERRCPGNVPSVPLRLVERTQIVVSVEIDHHGPYDFLLDTGAQVTVLDTKLADELHLAMEGTTGVVGVGSRAAASWARLATLEAGPHSVSNTVALVQSLGHLTPLDRHIRGILGGNFLSHFDLLLDYDRMLVCLDSSGAMGQAMKGNRTAFVAVPHAREEAVLSTPPVIRAFLGGRSRRELLLLLDSGTNEPLLYNAESSRTGGDVMNVAAVARGMDGAEHGFAVLPAKDLRIEGNRVQEVSFIIPTTTAADVPQVAFDGLLPTSLFKRIFISYSGRYAVIDP